MPKWSEMGKKKPKLERSILLANYYKIDNLLVG